MTKHTQSIQAFSALGDLLSDYTFKKTRSDNWIEKLDNAIVSASNQNKWFTKDNLYFCLSVWGQTLNKNDITEWLAAYPEPNTSTRLALVLAGNIPLVGLHDVICGLASGCSIEVKRSSNDTILLPLIVDFLASVMPEWKDKVRFAEGSLILMIRLLLLVVTIQPAILNIISKRSLISFVRQEMVLLFLTEMKPKKICPPYA